MFILMSGSMCFVYIYENRTMKPVEIVPRWGDGGE
jgi:hypothetical protein